MSEEADQLTSDRPVAVGDRAEELEMSTIKLVDEAWAELCPTLSTAFDAAERGGVLTDAAGNTVKWDGSSLYVGSWLAPMMPITAQLRGPPVWQQVADALGKGGKGVRQVLRSCDRGEGWRGDV